MRSGGAKRKGNNFESLVAKKISLWITDGKRPDVLVRTSSSGARSTALLKGGVEWVSEAGDITSVAPDGYKLTQHFLLETKHYKTLNLLALIYGTPKDGILTHWSRLKKDCKIYKKMPMYITRENSRPILISLDGKGKEFFKLDNSFLIATFPQLDIYIYQFEDFLKNVKF